MAVYRQVTILLIVIFVQSCVKNNHRNEEFYKHRKNDTIVFQQKKDKFFLEIEKSNNLSTSEVESSDSIIYYRDKLLERYKGKTKFSLISKVKNKEYSLEVVTYYLNDRIIANLDTCSTFEIVRHSPIILDQKLVFKKFNKILKVHRIPNWFIPIKTINGLNVKKVGLNASYIQVVKGSKSDIYELTALNDCINGCIEFFGDYEMNGDIIYEMNSLDTNRSDINSILLNKYGISEISFDNRIKVIDFW